jgi:hypothetical protein
LSTRRERESEESYNAVPAGNSGALSGTDVSAGVFRETRTSALPMELRRDGDDRLGVRAAWVGAGAIVGLAFVLADVPPLYHVRVHGPRVPAVQQRARCGSMKADPADIRPETTPEGASVCRTGACRRLRCFFVLDPEESACCWTTITFAIMMYTHVLSCGG